MARPDFDVHGTSKFQRKWHVQISTHMARPDFNVHGTSRFGVYITRIDVREGSSLYPRFLRIWHVQISTYIARPDFDVHCTSNYTYIIRIDSNVYRAYILTYTTRTLHCASSYQISISIQLPGNELSYFQVL